jgi:hypothetical protein
MQVNACVAAMAQGASCRRMGGQVRLAVGILVAMLGGPALAQEAGWSFSLSPYLWTPGISSSVETRFGTLDAEAGIDDVLSATDFALMGAFEARNGRWGLIADLVYSDLTERSDTPFGALFSRARVDTDLTMATLYAGYRLHEDDHVAVDLLGGARAVWLDIDVALTPGALPARSFGLSESWVDPLIGGRARLALTERWFATGLADIGGFDAGSDLTWQVLATIGYQFNPRWSVQGGWRQLAIEKEMEGRDVELDLGGPAIGFTVRF